MNTKCIWITQISPFKFRHRRAAMQQNTCVQKIESLRNDPYHFVRGGQCWARQGHQHDSIRSSAPCQSACCSSKLTLSKSSVEPLMLLNPACAEPGALAHALWPDVATGITDEAGALNCLCMIPRLDPALAATSSASCLSLYPSSARVAPIVGQLAHIQEHQNIVRTTLCAPAPLLSKLTFKSKMESLSSCLLPGFLLVLSSGWINKTLISSLSLSIHAGSNRHYLGKCSLTVHMKKMYRRQLASWELLGGRVVFCS